MMIYLTFCSINRVNKSGETSLQLKVVENSIFLWVTLGNTSLQLKFLENQTYFLMQISAKLADKNRISVAPLH